MTSLQWRCACTLLLVAALAGCGKGQSSTPAAAKQEQHAGQRADSASEKGKAAESAEHEKGKLLLSAEEIQAAGITVAPLQEKEVSEQIEVTASIGANQDRFAHVAPRRKGKQICLQILEALPSARMFCRQISPHAQESKFVYTEHWQENLSVRSFRSSPVGVSC